MISHNNRHRNQQMHRIPCFRAKTVPSLEKKVIVADTPLNYAPEEVREVATRGFFALDDGFKNWLSGIKIPTLDSYKVASVHVVNQDRSILSWRAVRVS